MAEHRKYWNPRVETMPRNELRELQIKKLHRQLVHLYDNSPFYGQKLKKAGVDPAKIKTLEDFEKYIPITAKSELRAEMERTGEGLPHLCVHKEEVFYIASAPGTTGMPTYQPMTKHDFELTAEMIARNYWMCGFRPGMRHHAVAPAVMFLPHLYAHKFLLHQPLIPIETHPVFLEQIVYQGRYLKPDTIFISVPLYTAIEERLAKENVKPRDIFAYKVYVNYGDVFPDWMREHCEKVWGGKHFSLGGSGADVGVYCTECEGYVGMHFPIEDNLLMEVVDLKTGRAVPSGGRGELLYTDIERVAGPHLRWRTEDLVDVWYEPCECGRTSIRVKYVGRTTFKTVVRGKDIFPIDVEEVIRKIPETATYKFTILKYAEDMDRLRLRLGCSLAEQSPELKGKVEDKVGSALGVSVEVEFCKPEELPRVAHKFVRMVDLTKEKT